MLINPAKGPKTLLHACCGPCTLEPSRLLSEDGHELSVYYANSNIHPASEYQKRLDTLRTWAYAQDFSVQESDYEPKNWESTIASAIRASSSQDELPHESRCRACYRFRFEQSAYFASKNGFDCLSTTLSVSPYQYTDIIEQELVRAAHKWGLQAEFRDFRPQYAIATRKSRELGMYRQNYCGCHFSDIEAEHERRQRKDARKHLQEQKAALKAAWEVQHADELAAQKAARAENKRQKQLYAQKQQRKREVLKALREQNRSKKAHVETHASEQRLDQ